MEMNQGSAVGRFVELIAVRGRAIPQATDPKRPALFIGSGVTRSVGGAGGRLNQPMQMPSLAGL